MEKIRLLLYCTKSKPILMKQNNNRCYLKGELEFINMTDLELNGKIVAECDFEVEKIIPINVEEDDYDYGLFSGKDLLKESCLSNYDIFEYLQDDDGEIFNKGYAIYIKNLNIFGKPRGLFNYCGKSKQKCEYVLLKAPQNMMYCYGRNTGEKYILISVSSEEMARICNGEQTVLVRKNVLKEML